METIHNCSHTTAEKTTILNISSMMILSVVITLGNVVSLSVFLGSRHFQTPQGYLKASLATADIAVGVLVIPYSVYTEIHVLLAPPSGPSPMAPKDQGFGPRFLMGPVFAGCTLVSVFTIFLLSVERSIAVLTPLHQRVVVTKSRTRSLILVSWLLYFGLAVSPLLLSDHITLDYSRCSQMCNYVFSAAGRSHSHVQSTTGGGWSIMLLFPAFNLTLLGTRFCNADRGALFSDLQAAKTVFIITALLSASVAPVAVLLVGHAAGFTWCHFSLYAFWILACSSGWNVLVYSARDGRFRRRARELFLGTRRSGRGGGGSDHHAQVPHRRVESRL